MKQSYPSKEEAVSKVWTHDLVQVMSSNLREKIDILNFQSIIIIKSLKKKIEFNYNYFYSHQLWFVDNVKESVSKLNSKNR